MHLDPEEIRKIQNQVQRVSHSVVLNPDASFTCRRRYQPMSTVDQFALEIRRILMAARLGKIEILEKTLERVGPDISYLVVRFKQLR